VTVSSQGHEIPLHVRLRPTRDNGLKNVSWVKCEQLFTVSKDRLRERLGRVTPEDLRAVERAIALNLDLPLAEPEP
jgi:mRNA interferase MazF